MSIFALVDTNDLKETYRNGNFAVVGGTLYTVSHTYCTTALQLDQQSSGRINDWNKFSTYLESQIDVESYIYEPGSVGSGPTFALKVEPEPSRYLYDTKLVITKCSDCCKCSGHPETKQISRNINTYFKHGGYLYEEEENSHMWKPGELRQFCNNLKKSTPTFTMFDLVCYNYWPH